LTNRDALPNAVHRSTFCFEFAKSLLFRCSFLLLLSFRFGYSPSFSFSRLLFRLQLFISTASLFLPLNFVLSTIFLDVTNVSQKAVFHIQAGNARSFRLCIF
jgi:hypothetical protein